MPRLISALSTAWRNFLPILAVLAFIALAGMIVSLIIVLLMASWWLTALAVTLASIYGTMVIYELVR